MNPVSLVGAFLQQKVTDWAGFFGFRRGPYESGNFSPRREMAQSWRGPIDGRHEYTSDARGEIVRRSRYVNKNSGVSREIKRDMQIYSVGNGLMAQSKCDDIEIDGVKARILLQDYFEEWATRCEITNRFCFGEVQGLVCSALESDGEHFVVKAYDRFKRPKLQLIESHRVGDGQKNNSRDGILFDEFGAFTGIRVIEDDGTSREVPANAVCHVFEPEQVSLVRNPPTGQHGINHLIDEMEILAMEKHNVKQDCDVARVLKTEDGDEDETGVLTGGSAVQDASTDVTDIQKTLGGRVAKLKINETLESYESKRPNATFKGFLEHLDRDACAGQIPYDFAMDPSQVGGASVRLVVGKADRAFTYRQFILSKRLLGSVWAFVIGYGISKGELPVIPNWQKVDWQTPRRVTVDAGRESAATLNEIITGSKTFEDDYAERGMKFEEQMLIRARNAKLMVDLAKENDVPLWMLYGPQIAGTMMASEQRVAQDAKNKKATESK